MPSIQLTALSGRFLSFVEREEIALLRAQDLGVREIARRVGRSPSTISRELRRNAATRSGYLAYRASIAQWKAELMARRPKTVRGHLGMSPGRDVKRVIRCWLELGLLVGGEHLGRMKPGGAV